jgi:hypothetical protein
MKRDKYGRCKHLLKGSCSGCDHETIAKQNAKIRDLKARLKRVAECPWRPTDYKCEAALDLKNKNWRKDHVCVTRSGDEQVLCDDPKCPEKSS